MGLSHIYRADHENVQISTAWADSVEIVHALAAPLTWHAGQLRSGIEVACPGKMTSWQQLAAGTPHVLTEAASMLP